MSFSYIADAPVIKDVSFTCPGGKTLAFVGATGAPWGLQRWGTGQHVSRALSCGAGTCLRRIVQLLR